MDRRDFEKLVKEAISSLPKEIQKAIDNVGISIEKWPQNKRLERGLPLGLYQGVPKTAWGRRFSQNLPDKITIFQGPIEKLAGSQNQIKKLVKIVVWHELAHHFGFDEKKIKELENKWQKRLKE